MIAATAYMLMFLIYGVMTAQFLLPRHRPLNRLWIGLCLGLLEEMWLPALCAFFLDFTVLAHMAAALVSLVITLVCFLLRDRREAAKWDAEESRLLKQMLWVGIPLTVLGIYLQYTHVMRVDSAGNWNVGQSTYGDLPMHLSFITNLPGKKFPADYPFFPGARLSYPFLTDSLSSTFYLMGMSLQASTIVPAALMMALCYMGVMVLAREMTAGGKAVVLAALLFFLNGGLGFLYDFDMAGGNAGQGYFDTVWERIESILTGYYKTPTNQPDPNNLRWSNMICDMMVPQRTLLGGYCMVFPCIYLLDAALRPRKMDRKDGGRALILLAVWGGALPLIHTHSFLALGLMSIGAMAYDLIHGDPKAMMERRSRWMILLRYAVYGLIAIALAAPQLIFFTFRQALSGEAQGSFLKLQFNWVNNPNGAGMRDLYLWFYIKNIGLPFIALILALFEKKPRNRRLFAMMLPIILAAELVRFQPNEYDNNKLFYLAWLLGCMIVADWCCTVWDRLKGMRGRTALAVLCAVVTFLSAGLTVWRECVSDYMAFSRYSVEAGEFARDETPDDAVYLTGRQHLNPVLSIAGKTIVCGPDLWLYWHGINTTDRDWDIRDFYEEPEEFAGVLADYDVSYIYVSSYERSNYDVDEEALRRNYTVVFENPEAVIYKVPEG